MEANSAQAKTLTPEQARELKWFCKNILGTRDDFYKAYETIQAYKNKIDRLASQADDILEYCKKNNIKDLSEIMAEGADE